MALEISNTAAQAMLEALVSLPDAGTPPGTVAIRSGSPPAELETADSGTLLVTITLNTDSWNAVSDTTPGAQATVNTTGTLDATATSGGTRTPGYFRVYNQAGTAIWQGTAGNGADLDTGTGDIADGATVTLTVMTMTLAET